LSVKVGLTGLWGSGKTTVLKFFEKLGAEVLDVDSIVHQLLQQQRIIKSIEATFGKDVIKSGSIDRKLLASKAFSSVENKRKLEEIIHPEVFKKIQAFLNDVKHIAIVEVPLLYETSSEKYFDKTILVVADEDVRISRLLKKGYSIEEIEQRLKHQISEEEKRKRADYIIDNSASIQQTYTQILEIWKDLVKI